MAPVSGQQSAVAVASVSFAGALWPGLWPVFVTLDYGVSDRFVKISAFEHIAWHL
jgi:hypothetical protein